MSKISILNLNVLYVIETVRTPGTDTGKPSIHFRTEGMQNENFANLLFGMEQYVVLILS